MDRILAVLFIGLALLGHSLSQYDSSGDGDDEDEEEYGAEDEDIEDIDEESGEEPVTLTACQLMRKSYKAKDKFEPKCMPNGQFVPRQCGAVICWCVDQQGKEIGGTRGITDCDGYANHDITFEEAREVKPLEKNVFHHPGVIAGVIGGIVVCLLCAVLIVMFIVYRMKKKDEGSYILGRAERKNSRSVIYTKAVPRDQEFYA